MAYTTSREQPEDMIDARITEHYRTVAQPLHNQNLAKFDALYALVNRTKGAIWTIGGIGTVVMTVLEIIRIARAAH